MSTDRVWLAVAVCTDCPKKWIHPRADKKRIDRMDRMSIREILDLGF
ncbi:hypothetical protein [Kamptonema sp. PCC 6506]|nr:hypothetical protein [Kamptonema sp. PCC 6506]CBN57587.1 hypothetical protein OSCI_3470015 [Kamptonema sp. PCC 6506]